MPIKIDEDTWAQVRDRMKELIEKGEPALHAAMQVSTELGGHPAPGTIMNRLRSGWRSPVTASTAIELRELRSQLQHVMDAIAERDEIIDQRDREIDRYKRELGELRERAARAEGKAEALREIAEPRINELRKARRP